MIIFRTFIAAKIIVRYTLYTERDINSHVIVIFLCLIIYKFAGLDRLSGFSRRHFVEGQGEKGRTKCKMRENGHVLYSTKQKRLDFEIQEPIGAKTDTLATVD